MRGGLADYFYGFDNQAIPSMWEWVLELCVAQAADPQAHDFAMHFMALEALS